VLVVILVTTIRRFAPVIKIGILTYSVTVSVPTIDVVVTASIVNVVVTGGAVILSDTQW
jgi:hypothetical protein